MKAVAKSGKRYIPPVGPVTLKREVEQVATEAHPTIVEGKKFKVTKAIAEMNKLNGWAK
ncbi:MAG TPA: hypothetical protein VD884_13205 [Ohtaekwangia sp.]|nr:hypothetical protein [Ohtaekwangia sp.]